MATQRIDISYAAHTASCTFLLDDEGICRRIVMVPKEKRRESSRSAARCVGAQYVASLDGSAAGGLVEMPRVGAAMLFARVDERGRVSLVRTGVVISFESRGGEDPFVDSQSVETSAPELEAPRLERHDDYYDPSERTQRIQALLPEDYEAALHESSASLEQTHDYATAEYASTPSPSLRPPTARSSGPTLRQPHRDTTVDDEDDSYSRPAPVPSRPGRGILPPRRSDPKLRAAAGAWAPEAPRTAPGFASDVQVTRRR